MSEQPRRINYRLIGHVASDATPGGETLGGTVTYAGLTAAALGAQVGIVTACAADVNLQPLLGTELITFPSLGTTRFKNRELPTGRSQIILERAGRLTLDMLPPDWRSADIIHLAPIADEVQFNFAGELPADRVFMTPQGWLRTWDQDGRVAHKSWENIAEIIPDARAVVCSLEDLGADLAAAREMASLTSLLAVTRSQAGALLFIGGQKHEIAGHQVEEVDPTGAGDIFAAVFFFELVSGSDPLDAAQRANYLAARSVTRSGLESVPTQTEIETARGSL
jgi:sugar/nucleoside kinase (ribokinase family)